MRRTKSQALETREHLLLAALEVFDRRGVARASLHEIAQEAGVTRGAFYWHFKNKEDVFEALFQRMFEHLSQQLQEDIRNNAPEVLASLRQALVNISEHMQNNALHGKFARILHLKCEHTQENAAIVAVMERYQQMWQQQVHQALHLCVQQGSLPRDLDISFAALYLKAAFFGLIEQWLLRPERVQLSRDAPRLIDATLQTLAESALLRTQAGQGVAIE